VSTSIRRLSRSRDERERRWRERDLRRSELLGPILLKRAAAVAKRAVPPVWTWKHNKQTTLAGTKLKGKLNAFYRRLIRWKNRSRMILQQNGNGDFPSRLKRLYNTPNWRLRQQSKLEYETKANFKVKTIFKNQLIQHSNYIPVGIVKRPLDLTDKESRDLVPKTSRRKPIKDTIMATMTSIKITLKRLTMAGVRQAKAIIK